jgi:hypothetical protein
MGSRLTTRVLGIYRDHVRSLPNLEIASYGYRSVQDSLHWNWLLGGCSIRTTFKSYVLIILLRNGPTSSLAGQVVMLRSIRDIERN